jgi:hypothetical protein
MVNANENPCRVLVYKQPTTNDGKVAYVMLSKTFILDEEPCFQWKLVGINYHETDAWHVVYIARGVGFDGCIDVVVPRRWN